MNRLPVYGALAGGIAVVSTAAILIRFAQAEGTPSLTIAALRLTLAAVILIPFARSRAREEWRELNGRHAWLALLAGSLLALHFGAWITSLELTSVASSTALVTTNPIWVGIGSVLLLRERLTLGMIIGIAVALVGTLVLLLADGSVEGMAGEGAMVGNGLAIIGAISASGYLLIGRCLRNRLSLLSYVSLAYGAAAVLLLLAAAAKGDAILGHSMTAYLCIAGLAIGPQLIGHTIINWSVRHMPATVVALSILGEPIGSSLLAIALLGERISALQAAAFALILCGIFVAARDSKVA